MTESREIGPQLPTDAELRALGEQRWEARDREGDARRVLESRIAELGLPAISLPKAELATGLDDFPVTYRPDDVIQIEPRPNDGHQLEWWVRNQTLSEESTRPLPLGQLVEVTPDQLAQFADNVGQINHRARHTVDSRVVHYRQSPRHRAYLFREGDHVTGWAYTSIGSSGESVHLNWLYVFPQQEGRGVASAILRQFQDKFSSINLVADSMREVGESETSQTRLVELYLRNGLVRSSGSAMGWSRYPARLSLDDAQLARDWHVVEPRTAVCVDRNQLDDSDLSRLYLNYYLTHPELKDTLPADVQVTLETWGQLNSQFNTLNRSYNRLVDAVRDAKDRADTEGFE